MSFASKGNSTLPIRLRRLRIERHEGGGTITLLTNDMQRSAVAIAALVMVGPMVDPPPIVVYAVLLVLGGAASGTVTTMAPAMATLMSEPDEQGDALSLSGTFRAGALFGAPATVGGLLSVMALVPALLVVVAAAAGPGLIIGRRRRR